MSTAVAINSLFAEPIPQGAKQYVDQLPLPPAPRRAVKDRVQAHYTTEDAIERNRFDEDWREDAMEAIYSVACDKAFFTSDDCWQALEDAGRVGSQNPSALGPCIRTAVKNGWIEGTGTYRVSERPETHRRPLRIWCSLICEAQS